MKWIILLMWFVLAVHSSYAQKRYDVVIDEIMADPTPVVGLPSSEWIELKNISAFPVSLKDWRIANASTQSSGLPSFTLAPDSFVIVTSVGAATALSVFGTTIAVGSFPSIDNSAGVVILLSAEGITVDAVEYSDYWYGNDLKKEGGWTLEMQDPAMPCAADGNWSASTDPRGGTPGRINSINAPLVLAKPPNLKYAYMEDSVTAVAAFDVPLDSSGASLSTNYSIDKGISIVSAKSSAPSFNTVELTLDKAPAKDVIYTLTVINLSDCSGNMIGSNNEARLGAASVASPGDIVVNEILYNPKAGGSDYVEYFNRSSKIINMEEMYAANRNANGDISFIQPIETHTFCMFPGDYLVVTENAGSLPNYYQVMNKDAVVEIKSMPSYPDDEGDVILLNKQGDIIDEVKYSSAWQFALVAQPAGVALERIDANGPSQAAGNWHSAASSAGYGTPGYRNSQFRSVDSSTSVVTITPQVISPDNDGHDDVAIIQYKLPNPGFVSTLTIFNSHGIPVRHLVKNEIAGINGQWTWDGLGDAGNRLTSGIYILFIEFFDLSGQTAHLRRAIVLAGKVY